MDNRPVILILSLALAACATAPTTTPTPPLFHVITTPALEGLVTMWAASYDEAHSGSPIELLILPPQEALAAVETKQADLVIAGLEPPSGWFVTPLSTEGIAVIVHPSNPLRTYDIQDLAALFTGGIASWEELAGIKQQVQPVIPLPGDEVRIRFEEFALDGSPPSSDALLAPTPLAMSLIVSEDPGAIGYLPFSQVSGEVRVVRVEGILPSPSTLQDDRYPLRIEILALAPQEPSGTLREWLAWLQTSQSSKAP